MNALITTAAFLLVTAFFVVRQVTRAGASGEGGTEAEGLSCPRCSRPVTPGVSLCAACGAPQQSFEVVAAPTAVGTGGEEDAGASHAVVRADLCVGCSSCADACPEEGALIMDGKLAVVDQELCQGHGNCVEACPVGGILLSTGAAVHRVQTPDVGIDFQSNVPGLFIVGELGGRGLIKNAINEGKLAVEAIAAARRPAPGGAAPATAAGPDASGIVEVAIVGSGPAGLSAGLEAKRQGMSHVILEQGTVADTIRKYPRKKLLLAEPVKVPLYGDLWVGDASKEALIRTWEQIIANTDLRIHSGHRVENIARQGGLFLLRAGGRDFAARSVVLAMGRRGTPRRLGVEGEDLDKVYYDIVEMEAFRGRRILVVGGGDSAVESALGLANQEGVVVHLSYRGDQFKRVKERNRQKLQEGIAAGRIRPLLGSQLLAIRPAEVVLETTEGQRTLPNDDVIIRIGGEAPFGFLEKLGVRIVEKDVPLPDAQASVS